MHANLPAQILGKVLIINMQKRLTILIHAPPVNKPSRSINPCTTMLEPHSPSNKIDFVVSNLRDHLIPVPPRFPYCSLVRFPSKPCSSQTPTPFFFFFFF
eukprot:c27599_g1_i1 orf=1-297(-)